MTNEMKTNPYCIKKKAVRGHAAGIVDLSEMGRANTTNQVAYEITRGASPTFTFLKNKGSLAAFGLVLNGKAWTGRHAAGEIGHMVIKRGGAHCPCGRVGCMDEGE